MPKGKSTKGDPSKVSLQLPRRGKPRRGRGVAKVSSVRIDNDTYTVLNREFGSLGNALFYLAEGIKDFRDRFGLQRHKEQVRKPSNRRLDWQDLQVLIAALDFRISYCVDGQESRPFQDMLNKIMQSVDGRTMMAVKRRYRRDQDSGEVDAI